VFYVNVEQNILEATVFSKQAHLLCRWYIYEGWNFNSGNYLFTTDTK